MLHSRVLKATAVLFVLVAFGAGPAPALSHRGAVRMKGTAAGPADRTDALADAEAVVFLQGKNPPNHIASPKDTKGPKASDFDKLQGTWIVVADEYLGRTRTKGLKDRLVISGSTFALEDDAQTTEKGTLTLDVNKNRKRIDFSITNSPLEGRKGKKILGIYSLDRDTLKICWTEIGGTDRPTGFLADAKHPQYNLRTYKRRK